MDGRRTAGLRPPIVASLAAIAVTLSAAGPGLAESTVLELDWRTATPLSGTVVDGAVEVATSNGGLFPLAVIEPPDLGTVGYALRGDVRYTDVAGQGYLELWSEFPDGGRYFSRTLAADGPLAAVTGTSVWRPFELPFVLAGEGGPRRLELNLVLPGAGTVAVGPVRLVRLAAGDRPAAVGSGPSIDQLVGLVGGLAGGALGIAGGTIGWLAARRRAPRAVLGAVKAGVAIGAGLIVAGVNAFLTGQPSPVAYTCLLLGGITAGVAATVLPGLRRAYAEAELRKMRALDRS
jgi:hypothetical protein